MSGATALDIESMTICVECTCTCTCTCGVVGCMRRQSLNAHIRPVTVQQILNKNSSGDEIANVNFLRRYGTYVLQNTKNREPTSFNQLDDRELAKYCAFSSEFMNIQSTLLL